MDLKGRAMSFSCKAEALVEHSIRKFLLFLSGRSAGGDAHPEIISEIIALVKKYVCILREQIC